MMGEVEHVLQWSRLELWPGFSANERLTQVNIAWQRRNGCSSEQSVSSKGKIDERRQDLDGQLEVQASGARSIRIRG